MLIQDMILFFYKIKGLITQYGGANFICQSGMEQNIPAAIELVKGNSFFFKM